MRRILALLLPLLAACGVPQPQRSSDPFEGGARAEGRLDGGASAAQTAFCVSRDVPLSLVVLPPDGAAVRPAPGTIAAGRPDYALTFRQTNDGIAWLRQVADADPAAAAAVATRLDRALAGCAPGGNA
jgi:hypothetical protein